MAYNQLQLLSNVSSGILHGENGPPCDEKLAYCLQCKCDDFCANATNSNTYQSKKWQTLLQKSTAKVTNSIAKTCNVAWNMVCAYLSPPIIPDYSLCKLYYSQQVIEKIMHCQISMHTGELTKYKNKKILITFWLQGVCWLYKAWRLLMHQVLMVPVK